VRTFVRTLAALTALGAAAVLVWIGVTLVWGEPFTGREAAHAQARLRSRLARTEKAWKQAPGRDATLRAAAERYRRGLVEGDAIGRIVIPRIGLSSVVVQGTAAWDLARGPGHYRITALPGLGGTVAFAGHRTTYGQPFRHIDALRPGDPIELELPYGTFHYRVYARRIVGDHDWSIIRRRPFEQVVLSACHPLYSASHRIVVFARLASAQRL
jgi:sortase A